MSTNDPIVNNPGEPEDGPFAREAYFMEQRLMGDCSIANLAAHRQTQLKQHRKNLAFFRDQQIGDQDLDQAPVNQNAPSASSAAKTSISGELNWVPLGPAPSLNGQAATTPPVSGRIEAMAVSPDGKRVYVGSANGGVWRSDDSGKHWVPTMNAFNLQPNTLQADSLSVGALVMSPLKPDRVYVGTGEGGSANFNSSSSASGSGYFGVGPVVSDDGGLTWMSETLEKPPVNSGVAFYPMAVDPIKPDRVVAPTSNGIYVREPRNETKFPATGYQPQSYLYAYKPANGATNTGYWNDTISGLTKAINFGPDAGLKDFDSLEPFVLNGVPYFIFYNATSGKFILSYFQGDAIRKQVSDGTWSTGLSLMPFRLNGLPHLAQYDKATGKASVIQWQADGSSTTVQAALTWPKNWTLLPLVIKGFPYFLGYNATDGSLALMQWRADATTAKVWDFEAGTWPNGATLAGFELNDRQYIIRYLPADGSYVVDRVQNNLFLVSVTCANAQQNQNWEKNLTLSAFTFNDDPYLLTYAPTSGASTLYGWTDVATPVKKWGKVGDKDVILMPFLMGFQWLQKKAPNNNANDRATAVVVASNGIKNTFFAAFDGGPVYKSEDNGSTWTKIGGDPGFTQRVSLAVQPTSPDLLYAIDKDAKIRRLDTTDPTHTWKEIQGTPSQAVLLRGQGNYDLVIRVLPSNADTIFVGGATVKSGAEWSGAIYRGKVKDDAGTLKIDSLDGKMTYIGGSAHADIHAMVFRTGSNNLWVGCDGGAFYAADAMVDPLLGPVFESMNAGLNTMTLERLGQHPTYDAVLFVGSQDNGCQRFLGDAAWTVVSKGDSGAVVVNRGNAAKVVCSYVQNILIQSSTNGNPDTFTTNVSVPTSGIDMTSAEVLFYAPLVGTPASSGQPDYLAFGANRPYLSTNFGSSWKSLPNNNNTDNLPSLVRSLSFAATSTILYVATLTGQVYRFKKATLFNTWTRTQIDNTANVNGLPSAAPITAIGVVPGDDDSLYICYGGQIALNGWKRVWYYKGSTSTWSARSGPAEGDPAALLNIQYNTLIFGESAQQVFVAGDLGVWQTTDAGQNWQPLGNGLPESAVLDLAYFPKATSAPDQPALLRASTYGRGVYEYILSREATYRRPVQLYIRDTILDRGLYPTVDGLTSPVDTSKKVNHRDSPDLKTIQVNDLGNFDQEGQITYVTYSDKLVDKSSSLTKQKKTRVYAQVQQRGVEDATNTSVRILLSTKFSNTAPTSQPTPTNPDPSPTPPALPDDLVVLLEKGDPVPPPTAGKGWYDLGTENIANLIVGVPKVVSVDIPAIRLPNSGVYCIVVVIYQAKDPFANSETNADKLAVADAKVAMKYLIAT